MNAQIYCYQFFFNSMANGKGEALEEWHCTSYDKALTHEAFPGVTFSPLRGLSHDAIKYDSEKSSGQLKVTVPRDFPVAGLFLGGYPAGGVRIRVIELDAEVGGTATTIWRGKVRSCTFNEIAGELTCTSGKEMLERLGLRLNAGPTCQWALGGRGCGVDMTSYTRAGTVTAVSADGVTVETTLGEAAQWFRAGRVKALGQVRQCNASVGGTLTLMGAISGLQIGDSVTAEKGCDRSASTTSGCKSFNNYIHFSGVEGFPTPRNIYTQGVA